MELVFLYCLYIHNIFIYNEFADNRWPNSQIKVSDKESSKVTHSELETVQAAVVVTDQCSSKCFKKQHLIMFPLM